MFIKFVQDIDLSLKITALIVTHNRLKKLKVTLQRTLTQDFCQVVIINCGSTDGTQTYLNTLDQKRTVIHHISNIGGAGGFAFGSKWITAHLKTDWILFFDDDAYPDKELIQRFNQITPENYQGIACHVSSRDERLPLMNTPIKTYPNTFARLCRYLIRRKQMLIEKQDLNTPVTPIETASFVGFFVRFDVLKQTYQNIIPSLFIYYDDLFYTHSLHRSGYKLAFMPSLKFHHDTDRQVKLTPWKIYFLTKNIFSLRPLCTKSAFWGLFLLKIMKLIQTIIKNKNIKTGFTLLGLGVLDGIKNNHFRFPRSNPTGDIIKYAANK